MDIEVGEIITLVSDENEEQDVEVISTLEVDGNEYVAVIFLQEEDDIDDEDEEVDVDVYFLRYDEASGDFIDIETDEEFSKVSSAFSQAMEEEFGEVNE
ncbi:DUF1292 domain-containing protein [Microaerobacter geothermalis]|uniref:DUF1292 domain-containing protein n=1 Tax=Microaerobacter geothermalis TaxID=674972 RepID=UPI001F1BFCCC|nr:DUF1292 domain-containing protein [Microaerobacter geothermalis]MCF6093075.1 DUF1292 domain-containing protein [Microaerobacter geothermalis]